MKSILVLGLIAYVGMGLYLYLQQRNFIYFPVADTRTVLKTRVFSNEGQAIRVSVLNEGRQKAILYFGGNAENVDYNSGEFSEWFTEYTVYLVKYRGYGGSSGTPTESGIYSDALYIYDEIRKDHKSVSVKGRSLGSGVATYVAAKRDIHKLVLVTPFDSILRVAQSQFPLYPIKYLLKDKYDSFNRAKDIEAETLVVAAELDQIINIRHTRRLVEGFSSDVQFHVIKGTGHNNISSSPDYFGVVGEFL